MSSFSFYPLITSFDCCSSTIGFTYNGKRRYRAFFGGILTIICLLIIIDIIFAYSIQYFGKYEKQVFYQDKSYSRPPKIDISKDYHIAIMMQYFGANVFMDNMIRLKAVYKKKDDDTFLEIPLSLYKCKRTDFPTNNTIFDTLELANAYYLNLTGIDLQGGNINVFYHSIQIQFLMCENEKGCATDEEIERYFEMANPTALIYFLDTVYDLQNKKCKVEKNLHSNCIIIIY